jgi:hypothetical protein
MPVLVVNADGGPMMLPHYFYLLAALIPQARIRIYPDAAHGFLFQQNAAAVGASAPHFTLSSPPTSTRSSPRSAEL